VPFQPGMCAGSGLPMRGANVVRKRSVTNPGEPSWRGRGRQREGQPTGRVRCPLAGGSAAGDGSDCRRADGTRASRATDAPSSAPAASGGQTPRGSSPSPRPGLPPAAGMIETTPSASEPPRARPGSRFSALGKLGASGGGWPPLIAVPLLTAAVARCAGPSKGDVSNWQTNRPCSAPSPSSTARGGQSTSRQWDDERELIQSPPPANRGWLFCQG